MIYKQINYVYENGTRKTIYNKKEKLFLKRRSSHVWCNSFHNAPNVYSE